MTETTHNADQTKLIVRVHIPKMCCPHESGALQKALADAAGIRAVAFDYAERIALFEVSDHARDTKLILEAVQQCGMQGKLLADAQLRQVVLHVENMVGEDEAEQVVGLLAFKSTVELKSRNVTLSLPAERVRPTMELLLRAGWQCSLVRMDTPKASGTSHRSTHLRLAAALFLAACAEVLELFELGSFVDESVIIALSVAAIVTAGFGTIVAGLRNLARLRLDMQTLMAVAVIGACLIGAWPEAAMVTALFEIGEAIESLCMVKAKNAVRALLDVTPAQALVRLAHSWQRLPVEGLDVGTVYRIEPGERAAMDGVVIEGSGAMDESMITGESLPVAKTPGDRIYGGTLGLDSTLTIRATHRADDSMSARILRAVQQAEQKKAPLQRFVDRFAQRYTPCVFVLAALTASVGPLITDLVWTEWLYRALVLLVISCPCALVISTPVTIASALALAARRGLLVKGGVYLEAGRELTTIALDKTGTVTCGKPVVTDVLILAPRVTESQALGTAAGLACMSSHPISRAVLDKARQTGLSWDEAVDFKAVPGMGTTGSVRGTHLALTNLKWLEEHRKANDAVRAAFESAYERGASAVALSDMFGVIAVFIVADTVKPNAKDAVDALKRADLTVWMLTGDNARSGERIAREVGIDNLRADLVPQEKLDFVARLDAQSPTGMAGDGINDAPALARARIGFAMGVQGSDTVVEAADVALMDDNIEKIAWFKHLSRVTHRTLTENIAFALAVKFGFAAAALAGHASMWSAVFADTGVCLIVVFWGMRLMRAGAKIDRLTTGV